jgi:hypothetical protein
MKAAGFGLCAVPTLPGWDQEKPGNSRANNGPRRWEDRPGGGLENRWIAEKKATMEGGASR